MGSFVALFLLVVTLFPSHVFASSQFEIKGSRNVSSAQTYICSRMIAAADFPPVQLTASGISVRPLKEWIHGYRGQHKTIEEMMAGFPLLLTLSRNRDEGGYAKIALTRHEPGEPKQYKFERGVIAALSSDEVASREAAVRELQNLVKYITETSTDVNLPYTMQQMWHLRDILQYTPTAEENSNLNQLRFERMLDIKSNILQSLVILEELERWGKQDRKNLEIVSQILDGQNTYSLGLQILLSIKNSPFFRTLWEFRMANLLLRRLLPRLHRLAGIYQPSAHAAALEIHMHFGHVIEELFAESEKGNLRYLNQGDIFGTDRRFRQLLSEAMLDQPFANLTLNGLLGLQKTLRDPKFDYLSEQRRALDDLLPGPVK